MLEPAMAGLERHDLGIDRQAQGDPNAAHAHQGGGNPEEAHAPTVSSTTAGKVSSGTAAARGQRRKTRTTSASTATSSSSARPRVPWMRSITSERSCTVSSVTPGGSRGPQLGEGPVHLGEQPRTFAERAATTMPPTAGYCPPTSARPVAIARPTRRSATSRSRTVPPTGSSRSVGQARLAPAGEGRLDRRPHLAQGHPARPQPLAADVDDDLLGLASDRRHLRHPPSAASAGRSTVS